jgi:hypothetical protein
VDRQVGHRAKAAAIRAVCGDLQDACRLIAEALAIPGAADTDDMRATLLPELVRCAGDAGTIDLAQRLLADAHAQLPYADHAQVVARARVAEARGRFDEALAGYRDGMARWAAFAMPYEEGHAQLGEARCLIALGRRAEARRALSRARTTFERLGAAAPLTQVAAAEDGLRRRPAASPPRDQATP